MIRISKIISILAILTGVGAFLITSFTLYNYMSWIDEIPKDSSPEVFSLSSDTRFVLLLSGLTGFIMGLWALRLDQTGRKVIIVSISLSVLSIIMLFIGPVIVLRIYFGSL